jgi:dipeptidyl aminopeptidase/acylaminoacyl peptidase
VSLELAGGNDRGGRVLVSGNDFYSSPRLSPDKSQLAWLTWNHPNMPWDGCELWVAEVAADGSLSAARKIAGDREESIFQPEWSPDGILHFVSDRTGWWNLYRWRDERMESLCEMAAEFGEPQWVFGMSGYTFVSDNRIACVYHERDGWRLATIDSRTHRLETIPTPYTDLYGLRASGSRLVFHAGSPTEPPAIVELDLTTRATSVLKRSAHLAIDPGYLASPQAIEFPTTHGQTAHAFFYPPRNRDFTAPPGERPPLLVMSHGGPTSAAGGTLDLEIQYWTSRGLAVLDVNYGGSTGYGRAYRERLNGQWGVVDVDDCVNGARYLVALGQADGKRLAIRGGSAGGYTTLCALTFRDTFRAGASHYGISDLETMAKETHKFESRYLDRLVGPYPERRDLYRERSPIHFADRLLSPVIFFQGLEDKVVLPDQAEVMVEALRKRGVPVAYLPFEGEQHGFRRAENIKRAFDAELYFYSRILDFELPDPLEPIQIDNLTASTP